MPKIGYLVPEFPSQTHIFFWREIAALKRRGVDVDLLSTRRPAQRLMPHSWSHEASARTCYLMDDPARGLAAAAVEAARFPVSGWSRSLRSILASDATDWRARGRLLASVALGARLAHRARTHGWHHVHAHICSSATDIALFAHLLSEITYSVTLHSSLGEVGPNQAEKWRHASFAITVTQTLLQEARQALGSALPARLEVAPMGVEVNKFRRADSYVPWGGTGRLRIFSCGRLNVGKGHADLIRAVALLRARGIDAHLRIAGEDRAGGAGYRRTLEDQIVSQNLADFVLLLGALGEEDVRRELGHAHIFALGSLNEALGVATMEAMSFCLPVVVTKVGGVPELVTDGEDGLLARSQAPDDLADKVERVARDPLLAARLGQAARRKIETAFHDERSAETLVRLLDEVPGALGLAGRRVSEPRPIPT